MSTIGADAMAAGCPARGARPLELIERRERRDFAGLSRDLKESPVCSLTDQLLFVVVFFFFLNEIIFRDAYNVDFFDDAIQGENGKAFKLKEGSFKNHFDKIEAGDYVTFKQVIVPLVPGPLLIPSSVVTYTEEKSGGWEGPKKISVVGSVDGFNVLTTAQANTKTLLNVGRYASFGFCKTLADWLRLAAIVGGIAAITLTKSTFTKAKAMGESRRRKQAMKALGVEDLKDN